MGAVESCCGGSDVRKSVDRSSSTNTQPKKPIKEKSDPILSKQTPTPPRREKDTNPPPPKKKKKKENISSSPPHEENTPPPPPPEVKKKEEQKKQTPPVPKRPTKPTKSLNNAKASVASKEQEDLDEVSKMLSQIESTESDRVPLPADAAKINTKEKAEERRKAWKLSKVPGDSPHEAAVLVFLCGDGGVGKTCVATSFSECGHFPDNYIPTKFDTHDVYFPAFVNNKPVRLKLRIVDTAGQEGLFNENAPFAAAGIRDFLNDKTCDSDSKGIVFFCCYSATGNNPAEKKYARTSFKNTDYDGEDDSWISKIDEFAKLKDSDKLFCKSSSIMLVGTKDDFADDSQRVVKEDEVLEQCKRIEEYLEGDYKIEHGYCSALFSPESVKKLFTQAVSLALTKKE